MISVYYVDNETLVWYNLIYVTSYPELLDNNLCFWQLLVADVLRIKCSLTLSFYQVKNISGQD